MISLLTVELAKCTGWLSNWLSDCLTGKVVKWWLDWPIFWVTNWLAYWPNVDWLANCLTVLWTNRLTDQLAERQIDLQTDWPCNCLMYQLTFQLNDFTLRSLGLELSDCLIIWSSLTDWLKTWTMLLCRVDKRIYIQRSIFLWRLHSWGNCWWGQSGLKVSSY